MPIPAKFKGPAASAPPAGERGRPVQPAHASVRTETRRAHPAGAAAEEAALQHLQAQGLRLLTRNFQWARGPGQRGGEIDLILREPDGTVVFVEVRMRRSARGGGAAASVGWAKQRALQRVACHYLRHHAPWPPCRFDVMACDAGVWTWLRGAFEAWG